ncbi:EAL domain-containing protein [Alteromonas sp. KUL49]|uniref:EAL domain-containing protein n=1 Tax=Alteromonas sp. KUL49 TaxID=2480798 RepID=UPI00102F1BC2|nr:EAL domain-containing protein [Alteromonas sp. KUL49]TAP41326.1 EAL domain-containing protein [Alteromonas sp. KUL49]
MRLTQACSFFVVWLTLIGIFPSQASAIEIADLQFTKLSNEDGLSSTTVLDIVEDHNGYIWLATMNGLNRYSGYEVKQYHPSDTNPNSLPSGFVFKLLVHSNGDLWAATNAGIARYRPESDDFEIIDTNNSIIKSNAISAVNEAVNGDVLFADDKFVYRYSLDENTVVQKIRVFDSNTFVKHIFDETSRTWVGSKTLGGAIINKTDNKVTSLTDVNFWGISLPVSSFHATKVIKGNYWLATDQGIYILSAQGAEIAHINGEFLNSSSSVDVFSLEEVDGNVWLGTNNGLYIITDSIASPTQLTKDHITHISNTNSSVSEVYQNVFPSILHDRNGSVWLGSVQGALRHHKDFSTVRYYSSESITEGESSFATIWGISQSSDGNIYFAAQQEGVGLFEKSTGNISYLEQRPTLPTHLTYWDLAIDSKDNFWVASSDGLLVYRKTGGVLNLVHHYFKGEFIDYIHQGNGKTWVWLGDTGLNAVNENLIGAEDSVDVYDLQGDHEIALPIYSDEENRLWLRKNDGLSIFDVNTSQVIAHVGSDQGLNSMPYSVYETSDAYWVTTRSDGVVQMNKTTFDIENKQVKSDNFGYIYSSIGIDKNIWYADNGGIHQISLPSLEKTLSISNQQLEFNSLGESAVLITKENEVFFAGNKGFNAIAQSSINDSDNNDAVTLAPELIEFSIFGTPSQSRKSLTTTQGALEENFVYSTPVTYIDEKTLEYFESRFSISFGLLNPHYTDNVTYRYRLIGLDNDWIYIGTNRTAQFNNVSFGSYTFEVQAREAGKEWSDSRVLAINVNRPPWLHSVALVFYALLVTVALAFTVRQYQIRKANQLAIRESEERLKLTLWSSGDELWDWDVYRGQVYRANTWGTLDFPQDDIRTTGAYDANIHPNDLPRVQKALKAHLEGKNEFYELAYRAKTFKNQWIWVLDRGKVVERDHNQQPVRMTGTLKNIHHLKEAEEQLNLFKRSIENISEGVFIANTHFKFISVNNAYCSYTGETREQALATYMHFHLYPDAFTEEIKKTLKAKGNWFGEVESVRLNGERFEIELNIDAVHDDDGKITHFVGVFSDITSRKNTEKELLKLANTDPLTELPNRSFFQASHQNLVRKSASHALLCLDMDNFKKINDSLGHQTGDILIKQIAKRLQRITGRTATCYRLGGDEFSVLIEENADVHTVTHYAQGLLDTLERPFIINKQEFVLGASIGIAFYPDDGTTPQEMLKNADTAMYFAKNNGGNSYQFFSGEMNQNAVRQLQIENLIRQGIKDDLFTVYYQPKVDIASGKLVSMEALVRFEHPQKGIVSPGQFIPLAEQTGQIIEIGEQVLRKACADTKRWVNSGLFSGRVAVNISAKQFELPDLDDRINRILNEVGLSPLHLECEITEGTLMENPENGLEMMGRLRERGIHLALDDFGTGYSSLAYLKRFPLNTLKIDKAFIDDIANSSVDRHMAAAIINIAHNLGLKVVAEGVEDEKQLNILRRYDCEMLQGFLYSRPLNAERFEKLLTENQQLHNLLGHSNI